MAILFHREGIQSIEVVIFFPAVEKKFGVSMLSACSSYALHTGDNL